MVTVVVHGTMSCRLPGLLTLHDAGCITEPMLRYEHDTFTGIAVNATELAGLIRQRFSDPGRPHIRLIAHSRGGLVARWARDLLADDPRKVDVVTLGTPHRGTPFVGRALSALAGPFGALGRVVSALRMDTLTDSGGAPITDPFTLASAYMVRPAEIPEGVRSMAPNADALAALERMRGAADFTAVGGECDLTQPQRAAPRCGTAQSDRRAGRPSHANSGSPSARSHRQSSEAPSPRRTSCTKPTPILASAPAAALRPGRRPSRTGKTETIRAIRCSPSRRRARGYTGRRHGRDRVG